MFDNLDKNKFEGQLNDALNFLTLQLDLTQLEINNYEIKVKCLIESISKIEDSLSDLNKNDSNAVLFSPTKNISRNNERNALLDERNNITKELNTAENEINLLKSKQINLDKSVRCLKTVYDSVKLFDVDRCSDNKKNNRLLLGINVLETQENERKRIARDLHDSTVQNMTNIMHKTELCMRLIDIDPIRAKLELQTMVQTIKTTINDMRNIIYDLRPMSIDDLGLVPTIEKYIKEINASKDVDIVLKVKNEQGDNTKEVLSIINLTLFRIIQEATNNSIKHGKVSKIIIDLEYLKDFIILTICDDGIGFNNETCIVDGANILSGFGLSIMKERVLLLAGEIKIESNDKNGTKIFVKVPLRIHKEDYGWSRLN